MAHYAKLDENNIVIDVNVIDNDMEESMGEEGIVSWLLEGWGGHNWIKTSYNGNIRKNFAGIGFEYDSNHDAFIPPKPFESWVLNEETCLWDSPVPYPEGTGVYHWNEDIKDWELVLV